MKYDVAIVGGGLAGLSFAYKMAQNGFSVVLFEKEKYPFHKVCGEYISLESYDFIESLGIKLKNFEVPFINKLEVSAPNGELLSHKLDLGGFGISRYTLDFALVSQCYAIGVKIFENTLVQDVYFENDNFIIIADNQVFNSRICIGSFGKRSNLDIKFNRKFIINPQPIERNYIGVKYHIKIDFPADKIALHNFKDGYCGISKIDGDGVFCLCYLTTAQNLRTHGSIKQMEELVLYKNPYLKEIFNKAIFLYKEPLTISQINFSHKNPIENHIIMCGDSAGLITPLCGNGMSMALHASKIASELASRFLKNEIYRVEFEKLYAKTWKKNFKIRLFVGRMIQYSFGQEQITNRMIVMLKKLPFVVDWLVKLTHGKRF